MRTWCISFCMCNSNYSIGHTLIKQSNQGSHYLVFSFHWLQITLTKLSKAMSGLLLLILLFISKKLSKTLVIFCKKNYNQILRTKLGVNRSLFDENRDKYRKKNLISSYLNLLQNVDKTQPVSTTTQVDHLQSTYLFLPT